MLSGRRFFGRRRAAAAAIVTGGTRIGRNARGGAVDESEEVVVW